MSQAQWEIILVAATVAASCALVGTFLVLRRLSLMSDAISHALLLGIVLAFLLSGVLASPFMIVAAVLTGLLTVALVETLSGTGLVKEDAAIGLVFPALFSVGVILVSRYASNIHLDTDAVLLGELVFAPFNRLEVEGIDLGPQGFWMGLAAGLLNLIFIVLFYKELKLATFDPALAAALGFAPVLLHYGLMALMSITAVTAFEAVGSVLVVALIVVPPAAAYLLTDRLPVMLALGVLFGVFAAVVGFFVARAIDASIAGSIAAVLGALFALTLVAAPQRGLAAHWLRARSQRWRFAGDMLLVHLLQHEGEEHAEDEMSVAHISQHMRWSPAFGGGVVRYLRQTSLARLIDSGQRLALTERGREAAREVMTR